MKKHIFISGIDTDCGKTYITGLLAKKINNLNIQCITSKIVQTGCNGISEDIEQHRKAMGIDLLPEDLDSTTCPFVYSFAASPHLSAKIDKIPFNISKTEDCINKLKRKYDIVLTEGAGGITVPLTDTILTSDYLKNSQVPVILVSSSKLGSLNHTILSIEYCRNNNINLFAVIYNQLPNSDLTISKDSFQYICNYLKDKDPDIKVIHDKDLLNKEIIIGLLK